MYFVISLDKYTELFLELQHSIIKLYYDAG